MTNTPSDEYTFSDESMAVTIWGHMLGLWRKHWPELPRNIRTHPALCRLKQVIDDAFENVCRRFVLCAETDMRAKLVSAIDRAEREANFVIDDLTLGWATSNGACP